MSSIGVQGRKGARYPLRRASEAVPFWLRRAPIVVVLLVAVAAFVALGAANGGFYATSWSAAGVLMVCLLGVALTVLGVPRAVPRGTLVAIAALGAFALWSYLSVLWAGDPGAAWDGANRTLVYLSVFALFGLWQLNAKTGRLVLGAFGLGIAAVGLVELLRADAAADAAGFFVELRFAEPTGYTNANAALWTLGALPCVVLASRREVSPWLRGAYLGSAGLLSSLAMLAQSRSWFIALPLALIAIVVIPPRRVRSLGAVLAVVAGTAAVAGPVLAVRDEFSDAPGRLDALLGDATAAILAMALVLALIGVAWGLVERRMPPSSLPDRRMGLAAAALVAVLVAGALGAYAVVEGSPFARASDAWADFKSGGAAPDVGESRLQSSSTNRYDFWRVAWDLFRENPVRGVGADNFQEDYLRRGRSVEQPRYAHSLQLGVLSQTGLIGALLLAIALVAALLAAIRTYRGPTEPAACAGIGIAVFVYWFVHGSVDWLWEFPALTAPALAMLAAGGALGVRRELPARRVGTALMVPAAVLALVVVAVLGALWGAERDIAQAAEGWRRDPDAAFSRLDRAATLHPFSARPQLTAATIALRLRRADLAEERLRAALARDDGNDYALFELGLLAAERGERARATRLLRRAAAANPRSEAATVLSEIRRGRRISVEEVNERIVRRAKARAR